jgi:hypothetical protein
MRIILSYRTGHRVTGISGSNGGIRLALFASRILP